MWVARSNVPVQVINRSSASGVGPYTNWVGKLVLVYWSTALMRKTAVVPSVPTEQQQFQVIENLGVLENYDVLSKFDALSELPVTPDAEKPQENQQTPDNGGGT